MEEKEKIELDIDQLNNFQNAVHTSMELIGDINLAGYTHAKLRKDTQRNLVEAYNILYALNKYIKRLKGKMINE